MSVWLVPLYVLSSFSSTLFLQLAHTLKEYFEEMAEEIAERNSQVRWGGGGGDMYSSLGAVAQ